MTNRKQLLAALTVLCKVVPKKPTVPILSNVRLECAPESVILTATNLDAEVAICLRAAPAVLAPRLVNAQQFMKAVKAATADELELTVQGNALTVGTSTLSTQGTEDYPVAMPSVEIGPVGTPDFCEALAQAAAVMSDDPTRSNLCGVFIERSPEAGMVAIDGRRLARKVLPIAGHWTMDLLPPAAEGIATSQRRSVEKAYQSNAEGFAQGALLPAPAVEAIAALRPLKVTLTGFGCQSDAEGRHQWQFDFEGQGMDVTLRARGEHVDFPNWRQVVPERGAAAGKLSISRAVWRNALAQAALAAGRNNKVALVIAEGCVRFEATCEEVQSRVVLDAVVDGIEEEWKGYFNYRYLLDAALLPGNGSLTMYLPKLDEGECRNPLRVEAASEAFAVVMPMRG